MSRVTLKTYLLYLEADLAKLRLDSLGIHSYVISSDSVFSGAIGGFKLEVDANELEKARGFLETYESELKSNQPEVDFEFPDEKELS